MKKRISIILVCLLFLTGCSSDVASYLQGLREEDTVVTEDNFLEQSVYEASKSGTLGTPNVLVDRSGYEKTSEKTVIFRGKEIEEEFEVVDKKTRETVYTGKIEKTNANLKDGYVMAKGDFSQLETEGNYYIQTPILGRSYTFEITNGIYKNNYENILQSFYYHRCGTVIDGESTLNNHDSCHIGETYYGNTLIDTLGGWHTNSNFDKNVVEQAKIVSDFLLTYEFFYEKNSDNLDKNDAYYMELLLEEISYEIPFILKMQQSQTGAFYEGVATIGDKNDIQPDADKRTFQVLEPTLEATGECAAVLAQFSRVYKNIDATLSATCLQAATKAYAYLEKSNDNTDISYYAASQLYKATGVYKYGYFVKNYNYQENPMEISRFKRRMYGDLAYLTTSYAIDVSLCTQMMDHFMERAQEIARDIKSDSYLATSNVLQEYNAETILDAAFVLAIVDHIVTSREYVSLIQSELHYIFGRNEVGLNLVSNRGVLNSVSEQEDYKLYLQSSLVFILYGLK